MNKLEANLSLMSITLLVAPALSRLTGFMGLLSFSGPKNVLPLLLGLIMGICTGPTL